MRRGGHRNVHDSSHSLTLFGCTQGIKSVKLGGLFHFGESQSEIQVRIHVYKWIYTIHIFSYVLIKKAVAY